MFNSTNLALIIGAGVLTAAACWLLLYGILLYFRGSEARVHNRIKQFAVNRPQVGVSEEEQRAQLRATLFAQLDSRWSTRTVFKRMKEDLAKADVNMTVSEFALVQVSVSIALAILLWVLEPQFVLLMVPVGLVLGYLLTRYYLRFMGKRRINKFEDQLPDTLSILASSVRGGFSLFQALQLIAKEAAEPSRTEFLRVVQEVSLGAPLDQALGGLAERIPTEDVEILATAITLQHQTGGNLSHVLDVVAHTVRERHRVQREIRSLTAQQRFSAGLLALLPILLAGLLFVISPTYIGHIFQWGWVLCMPVGALLMTIVGYIIMRRLAAIDV